LFEKRSKIDREKIKLTDEKPDFSVSDFFRLAYPMYADVVLSSKGRTWGTTYIYARENNFNNK
jgi:hypothetical protein